MHDMKLEMHGFGLTPIQRCCVGLRIQNGTKRKLNTAWQNASKSCLVLNDRYRVEFDRSNPTQPSGNQFDHGTETLRYGETPKEPFQYAIYSVPVTYNIKWSN
eukprot:476563_1